VAVVSIVIAVFVFSSQMPPPPSVPWMIAIVRVQTKAFPFRARHQRGAASRNSRQIILRNVAQHYDPTSQQWVFVEPCLHSRSV
jgi:hypothetical protein